MLVPARLGEERLGIFLVPKETRGLTVRPYRMVDGRRAADVDLTDVAVTSAALLGGYAKRLIVYELLFGSTCEHLRRYGAMIAIRRSRPPAC